jgi:hypothetical protein
MMMSALNFSLALDWDHYTIFILRVVDEFIVKVMRQESSVETPPKHILDATAFVVLIHILVWRFLNRRDDLLSCFDHIMRR